MFVERLRLCASDPSKHGWSVMFSNHFTWPLDALTSKQAVQCNTRLITTRLCIYDVLCLARPRHRSTLYAVMLPICGRSCMMRSCNGLFMVCDGRVFNFCTCCAFGLYGIAAVFQNGWFM